MLQMAFEFKHFTVENALKLTCIQAFQISKIFQEDAEHPGPHMQGKWRDEGMVEGGRRKGTE